MFGKVIKWFWILFALFLIAVPLYFMAVNYNFLNLFGEMPGVRMLEKSQDENNLASELYYSDGENLNSYFLENRKEITFDQLSPALVNTLVSTEDERFYDHSGIDLRALGRVVVKSLILQQGTGGGSTITQQVAKNLFKIRRDESYKGLLSDVSLFNMLFIKTKEWILSVKLEKAYTKKELVAMYLNTVEFGYNSFGVKVASKTYFNTTPDSITYKQAAMLVGLVQAPTRWNPRRNPDGALFRRNTVLGQVFKAGHLDQLAFDSLTKSDIGLQFKVQDHNEGNGTYFRTVAGNWLSDWAKSNGYNLYTDGLKIYTTLDRNMQEYAENAVKNHMPSLQRSFQRDWGTQNPWRYESGKEIEDFIDKKARLSNHFKSYTKKYGEGADSVDIMMNTPAPMTIFTWGGEIDTLISPIDSLVHNNRLLHTGFVALNPRNGAVKAWVGGINSKYFQYDHVYQGKRQPGSTFKPFVYGTAIENGLSPCYPVVDAPVTIELPGQPEPYTPRNSSGKYTNERYTLRQALARSVNTVSAHLMQRFGPSMIADFAHKVGIQSELEEVASLCLGSSPVSLLEMVGAYSTFANQGTYNSPYYIEKIEDKEGNVIYENVSFPSEALSEETAYLMLHMLRGGTEEAKGSGRGLGWEIINGNEVGAKTGTSQNASDGWFMTVTKDIVAGAWVGGDVRSIHFKNWASGQGAKTALPIVRNFLLDCYKDKESGITKGEFKRPSRALSMELDCSLYQDQYQLLEGDSTKADEPDFSF